MKLNSYLVWSDQDHCAQVRLWCGLLDPGPHPCLSSEPRARPVRPSFLPPSCRRPFIYKFFTYHFTRSRTAEWLIW
jgi:hypothetical protein